VPQEGRARASGGWRVRCRAQAHHQALGESNGELEILILVQAWHRALPDDGTQRAHERRLWRRFAESGPGSQRDEACGAATAGSGQGFASRMRRTGSRAARSGSGRLVSVRRMMMSHLRKTKSPEGRLGILLSEHVIQSPVTGRRFVYVRAPACVGVFSVHVTSETSFSDPRKSSRRTDGPSSPTRSRRRSCSSIWPQERNSC